MNPINALGLKVSALTGVIILMLIGLYAGGRYLLRPGAQEPAALQQAAIPAERTDADGDGLPDQFEPIYRTDSNNPDSDRDGTNDLAEITAGRNPLVAGTNDEVRPLTGAAVTDLSTYTNRYLNQLPADLSREQILERARLEAFVNVNKGELLPTPPASSLRTSDAVGADAIKAYLDQISTLHNPTLKNVTDDDIQQAFTTQLNDQGKALQGLERTIAQNLTTLQQVTVPAEAVALHTKLLAATQALQNGVQLLVNMPKDFVGGLIGSKKIEELAPVWQQIATDVKTLEDKYGIE